MVPVEGANGPIVGDREPEFPSGQVQAGQRPGHGADRRPAQGFGIAVGNPPAVRGEIERNLRDRHRAGASSSGSRFSLPWALSRAS